MNITTKIMFILTFFLLTACGGGKKSSVNSMDTMKVQETVTYELTFMSNWSSSTFPKNYPSNAHFSPLIGLTHNFQGGIFSLNEKSSLGIISMAETGSKALLKQEIIDIQNLGRSNILIDELGIQNGDTSISITFEASQDFPLLSIVSMVAPSPDWFIGIENLPLFINGEWLEDKTINLEVYDAGSDSGNTFVSSNNATIPIDIIKLLSSNRNDTDFKEGKHFQTLESIGYIKLKLVK